MRSGNKEYLPTAGMTIQRKVVKMGKSSYGVAFPKWWVQMYSLENGGTVYLEVVRENDVKIGPPKPPEKKALLDWSDERARDRIQLIVTPGKMGTKVE